MRRLIMLLVISGLLVSLSTAGFAADDDGPFRKLGRGIANVVTSPYEIIKGISSVNEEIANTVEGPNQRATAGFFAGFTYGIIKGVINCAGRAVVGVYEVGTFLIPIPSGYKPILDEPEFTPLAPTSTKFNG